MEKILRYGVMLRHNGEIYSEKYSDMEKYSEFMEKCVQIVRRVQKHKPVLVLRRLQILRSGEILRTLRNTK